MTVIVPFCTVGFADDTSKLGQAGIDMAVLGLQQKKLSKHRKKLLETILQGNCRFDGGWCPGAKVILKDGKDMIVREHLINSSDGFRFINLNAATYTLEVIYERYNQKQILKAIRPGGPIIQVRFDSATEQSY